MISFSDYVTNLNAGNPNKYSANQQDFYRNQYQDESNREQNNQSIQGWEQSRNPYYESLYKQQTGAVNQQAQQGYNDSLKKLQLQHLQRGTQGGSQSMYNQSQLGDHYNQVAAQGAQNTQNYVQGIRQNDKNRASQMRMDQYNSTPEMSDYYSSMMKSDAINADGYAAYTNGRIANMNNQQDYQNNMSQVYGAAINQGMSGAQSFAGMGV